MDGVLIDSEPAYYEMNKKLFLKLGIGMSDREYHRLVGMASRPMWSMLKKEYRLEHSVETLMNMEKKLIRKILSSDSISSPVEGIRELLCRLGEKEVKLAVASSSAKSNILLILRKLKLIDKFDLIASGDEVRRGKPFPDIFLKVSRQLRIPPAHCTVIEDSRNGITAAAAAGMRCMGFTNKRSNTQDISGADIVLHSFSDRNISRTVKFITNN